MDAGWPTMPHILPHGMLGLDARRPRARAVGILAPVTNAELIVRVLRDAGITPGFGVPSGNVLPLLEAMRTGGLAFVLTAREGSAAFAADVMGRLSGAPGLCLATLGPGATNLTTGVGSAYLDRSPLLALTCNLPTAQLGRRIQMAIDHRALFGPLTKASLALRRGRVAAALGEALELALAEPPGPVHLDLPEDVASAPATEDPPPAPRARRLRGADLVVGLGYDPVEVEYEAWIGRVPLLAVDGEPVDADASVVVAHEVVGDLDASLARLARAEPARPDWPEGAVREHRERWERALRPRAAGFAPHAAIDVVREVLPREGVLAFDVGAHTHQIAAQWTAHEPRTFLITNGWSSMGFGLPAAIAAKLARPERAVVALVGDGCFQMTCGEVAVARRLGLALPIVVLDDGWLSLIRVKQQRRGLGIYGTELGRPAFLEPPAHYFGVPAVGVRTPEALAKALGEALRADHPTVIEAAVDPAHYLETVYD